MILNRLMKKQKYGTYKVVGYQKQENGKIYHKKLENKAWYDIIKNPGRYIQYDRIDRGTGIYINKVEIFERDIIKTDIYISSDCERLSYHTVVRYYNGKWSSFCNENNSYIGDLYYYARLPTNKPKIVGIEGA